VILAKEVSALSTGRFRRVTAHPGDKLLTNDQEGQIPEPESGL
jgi:hypothetical protein